MGERTGIEWTDHTFNPWWGCTKVGPGCDHCYAEVFDKRVGGDHWGAGKERRIVKDWSGPRKWHKRALKTGEREWVFCASMADIFDNEVPKEWRTRFWDLVRETPLLKYQIVTKRIGNAEKMLPADWLENFQHVGILATIVNQQEANRDIRKLIELKQLGAHWIGLSMEPLLGPVNLEELTFRDDEADIRINALSGECWVDNSLSADAFIEVPALDWVIIGGESGAGARSMDLQWAENLIAQCERNSVPVFMKQLGAKPTAEGYAFPVDDGKGKDMEKWPGFLRKREFPKVYDLEPA